MLRRVLLALVALTFFAPSTASADPGFACRGTGARIELAGNPQTLFTAGGGVPCQSDSSALTAADGPSPGLDANVLRADTATRSTASARVSGLHLASLSLRADEVNATATARCVGGEPVLEGTANASGLSVAGLNIAGDDATRPATPAASRSACCRRPRTCSTATPAPRRRWRPRPGRRSRRARSACARPPSSRTPICPARRRRAAARPRSPTATTRRASTRRARWSSTPRAPRRPTPAGSRSRPGDQHHRAGLDGPSGRRHRRGGHPRQRHVADRLLGRGRDRGRHPYAGRDAVRRAVHVVDPVRPRGGPGDRDRQGDRLGRRDRALVARLHGPADRLDREPGRAEAARRRVRPRSARRRAPRSSSPASSGSRR